uniref:Uncharacterized protein n=1 Tax=Arundo donax TaxID=35708 RepID=A0A0A8YFA7_ARUDO
MQLLFPERTVFISHDLLLLASSKTQITHSD